MKSRDAIFFFFFLHSLPILFLPCKPRPAQYWFLCQDSWMQPFIFLRLSGEEKYVSEVCVS
ncbi:unnamed protein product [Ixodes persulcatus]